MKRPAVRSLVPLLLLVALMAARASACRPKGSKSTASTAAPTAAHWITPLMTPPPPRPTVTMWKGATRVPQLPE